MTISVVVLARGGCSAHGGAWWDPHDGGLVQLHVLPEDAITDVVIQYPVDISELDYTESGIDGSEPVISGNQVTLQFQTINPCGRYRIDAVTATGAKHPITFQAHDAQTFVDTSAMDDPADDDDDDPGAWG